MVRIGSFAQVVLLLVLAACWGCEGYNTVHVDWVKSPSEDYDHWAGRMRFQVNDTLVFKYKKEDSVLQVDWQDYYSCNWSNPTLTMSDSEPAFKFDRSGRFYFISGIGRHCKNGQRLMVTVMAVRSKRYEKYNHKFYIGGRDGWVVRPSEDYNNWAGRNRFQVNDSLVFVYKKGEDSVLQVTKQDYNTCNTSSPITKLTNGLSLFKLTKSGPFYFISGVQDHCNMGQKLIVVVLAVRSQSNGHDSPPSPPNQPTIPSPSIPSSSPRPSYSPSMPPSSSSPRPSYSPSMPPSSSSPQPSLTPSMPPSSSSPQPSLTPSMSPSSISPKPSLTPSMSPSSISPQPSLTPSISPSSISPQPSLTPSMSPSSISQQPSLTPSMAPSYVPSISPSSSSYSPSISPSSSSIPSTSPQPSSNVPSISPSSISPQTSLTPSPSPSTLSPPSTTTPPLAPNSPPQQPNSPPTPSGTNPSQPPASGDNGPPAPPTTPSAQSKSSIVKASMGVCYGLLFGLGLVLA